MVNINEIYDAGEHLKAADIGQTMPTVTMGPTTTKTFDNGDRKLVVSIQGGFQGQDKSIVLNVTNARAIGEMYGQDTDHWIGKQILLFTMPVEFNGNQVQAIRVRAPAETQPMQQQHDASMQQQPPQQQQGDPGATFPGDS